LSSQRLPRRANTSGDSRPDVMTSEPESSVGNFGFRSNPNSIAADIVRHKLSSLRAWFVFNRYTHRCKRS